MSEYKRLTERTTKGFAVYKRKCNSESIGGNLYIHAMREEEVLDRLAELEDKIEQGLMIELPCKIGDIVAYKRNNEYYAHRYIGNLKFECLSHTQGYSCDYILIGQLICGDDSIAILDREANKGNSIQFKPFKHIERAEAKLKELED